MRMGLRTIDILNSSIVLRMRRLEKPARERTNKGVLESDPVYALRTRLDIGRRLQTRSTPLLQERLVRAAELGIGRDDVAARMRLRSRPEEARRKRGTLPCRHIAVSQAVDVKTRNVYTRTQSRMQRRKAAVSQMRAIEQQPSAEFGLNDVCAPLRPSPMSGMS